MFRDQSLKIKESLPIHPNNAVELIRQLPEFAAVIQTGLEQLPQIDPNTTPGTVIYLMKNTGAFVMTGDGLILIREAQMAGKRSQSGWDFVNGTRMAIGEILR